MNWTDIATGVAALGAGITGGALWAFSSFVMPALGRTPAPTGITAMQAINRAAPTPWLMVPFIGTALLSVPLAIGAVGDLDASGAGWRLAGAVLMLVTVAITAAFHIPRNEALDRMDASTPQAAAYWANYLSVWTVGNHVRTATALAAAAALVRALTLA